MPCSGVIDPSLVVELFAARTADDPLEGITSREREVLALMAEGHSNTNIARTLVVSDGAVEKHISSIFAKLGLPPSEADNRRVLAVLRYVGS